MKLKMGLFLHDLAVALRSLARAKGLAITLKSLRRATRSEPMRPRMGRKGTPFSPAWSPA